MARSRLPALYGVFQFCLRLAIVVVEVCALAALATLTRYGDSFPLGYVTVCAGIFFSMTEMVTLADSTYQIPRLRSGYIVVVDFTLFVLGIVSFFYFIIRNGWKSQTRNNFESPEIMDDRYRDEKIVWAPWFLWLQLIAAVMHFLYMVMHCIDACRETPTRRHRRHRGQLPLGGRSERNGPS